MDVQEMVVTQEHLAHAHERLQAVVLPTSENAAAAAELRRTRIDLEHVSAYLWGARVLADELGAHEHGTTRTVRRDDVDLLERQCVMVEEMTASAARHLRNARATVGQNATAGFATGVDVAQHALSDIAAGARSAGRSAHELTRDQPAGERGAPAVRRMRAAQREHSDRAVPDLVGPRR